MRPDAVQVITVHQAKGMRWPTVFVPCLRQNRFPSNRHGGRTVWHVIPDTTALSPDLIIGGRGNSQQALERLAQRGLPVMVVDPTSLPEVERTMLLFGKITGGNGERA